jgi:hypothetical protein
LLLRKAGLQEFDALIITPIRARHAIQSLIVYDGRHKIALHDRNEAVPVPIVTMCPLTRGQALVMKRSAPRTEPLAGLGG